MPLFDVTRKESEITPEMVEKYDWFQIIKNRLNQKTLDRIIKTIDQALDHTIKEDGSLTWTKTGALIGHQSLEPKRHVDHLWDRVIEAVGDGKECLLVAGILLRWRISQRPEKWLLYRRETDSYDEDGNLICISEYWIDRR